MLFLVPGLNKICRRLQIDCAPALVGFDYHSGGSHPSFDGYIVCEEFEDQLIIAWEEVSLHFITYFPLKTSNFG